MSSHQDALDRAEQRNQDREAWQYLGFTRAEAEEKRAVLDAMREIDRADLPEPIDSR